MPLHGHNVGRSMKCLITKLEYLVPSSSLSRKSIIIALEKSCGGIKIRLCVTADWATADTLSWWANGSGENETCNDFCSFQKRDWYKLLYSACIALFLSLNQKRKTVTFSTLLTSSAPRRCLQPEMSFMFGERSLRPVSCTVHQLLIYPQLRTGGKDRYAA